MKALRWAAINAAFAACLYYGLEGHGGLLNIGLFLVWVTVALSPFMLMDKYIEIAIKTPRSVPYWLDASFDAGIVALLVYNDYIITGVFYFLHLFIGAVSKARRDEKLAELEATK